MMSEETIDSYLTVIGTDKSNRNRVLYVFEDRLGNQIMLPSHHVASDYLLQVAPLEVWHKFFPGMVPGGISWQRAKSWIYEQARIKGQVNSNKERNFTDFCNMLTGDYIRCNHNGDYVRQLEYVKNNSAKHSHCSDAEFAGEWDEVSQQGIITRIK